MSMSHKFVGSDKIKLNEFVAELKFIGCCELCVLRYLGVTDSEIYEIEHIVDKILGIYSDEKRAASDATTVEEAVVAAKHLKRNTCVACLGLLQEGIEEAWLELISSEIVSNGIEADSYCASLFLPISINIRAYYIWFHLEKKFGDFLKPIQDMKPEGANMKSIWKGISSFTLRQKINQNSTWCNNGELKVEIILEYEDEEEECAPLGEYIIKTGKQKHNFVTRGAVEGHFRNMKSETFFEHFQSPPTIPTKPIKILSINCAHEPMFIAGRYCKYSRNLSQTPWILNNKRKTEVSVEELMSCHILPAFNASESRFSSSGREDVDVRTLGKGRPFVFELINPKKTIFTPEKIKSLQHLINSSTELISVRDLQLVQKKDLGPIKVGEASKSKVYCALCILRGQEVTEEQLKILNNYQLPITLKQRTPVRVLHRRSLATRERRIIEMSAEPVKNSKEMFKLYVRTDAGTYVKEFVHGDFGRTQPNISTILDVDADILALDVTEVALEWPPALD